MTFVFSCKSVAGGIGAPSAPESPPPVPVVEETGEGTEEESPAGLTGETVLPEPSVPEPGSLEDQAPPAAEVPSETPFAGEPPLAAAVDALPEPFIDLPESEGEEIPPGETPFAAAPPEPAAPILPEPPLAAVPAQPPPLPDPPAPAPQTPRPAPVPQPAPAPERPVPVSPVPPPFIRPAEEAPDPDPVQAPVPPPPDPPAEPPAWTRQNQAESRPAAPPPSEPGSAAASSPAAPASSPELSLAADEGGIHFSRIVRATVGQLVEIPFRGTGWVYLGEMGFRQGLVYGSRRLDPEGQSFIFRAEAAGTYGLKFYKQDFVRDYILNDYVQVIVGEPPEAAATGWFNPVTDRGRAIAEPRWPTAAEEAEAFRNRDGPGAGGANPAGGTQRSAPPGQAPAAEPRSGRDSGPAQGTDLSGQSGAFPAVPRAAVSAPVEPVPAETPPSGNSPPPVEGVSEPPADSPDQYLRRAREEFEAGRVASALAILDRFRESYPAGSDETWWLYGQFYEANSPSRDIRSSLDYYRRLLREYPQSSRCNEARRRIAYLERYYINIR